MSQVQIGIVGLPNVGKSTLFNALLKRQQAYVANFPFATIEPNVGVVPVPDKRLSRLAEVVHDSEKLSGLPPEVPSTVEFVDIAGLIAGASQGAGLGNKFLAHIREVDAICHVVRVFSDSDIIKEGSVDPKADLDTVETELKLADLQTLQKQKDPGNTPDKEKIKWWNVVKKLTEALSNGVAAREIDLSDEEKVHAKQLSLLTIKPIMIVLNVSEDELRDANKLEIKYAQDFGVHVSQVIAISAKIESELSDLSDTDQKNYLDDLGVQESGLERLVKKAYSTLGLISFLTAGEKEVRAWTIKNGDTALQASGAIHTDFMSKFIKADIATFDDFVEYGGWKNCREKGKVRSEGRDYLMVDGDVVEFKIGS